jgi:hypothetical protein
MPAEAGLVTLSKIVGLLVVCISTIPLILLFSPGTDVGEPADSFGDE